MDGLSTGDYIHCKEASHDYLSCEYSFWTKDILCGRTIYEEGLPGPIDLSKFHNTKINRDDYIVKEKDGFYTIALDSKGKLKWTKGYFCIFEDFGRKQKAQAISILTELVNDDYLAYLQSIGVSYIFAGKEKLDLKIALQKLKNLFGIERILCKGGPTTNEQFIKQDLVQKVIFYQCPYITPGGKRVFGEAKLSKWNFESMELFKDKSTLILSYMEA